MPYELFIGLRYLKVKRKSAFISIITLISTAGVALGVMALIIVLVGEAGVGHCCRRNGRGLRGKGQDQIPGCAPYRRVLTSRRNI